MSIKLSPYITKNYSSNIKPESFGIRLLVRASTILDDLLRLVFGAGELARRWNPICNSLLVMYEKLKRLGNIYYNGSEIFLNDTEENNE